MKINIFFYDFPYIRSNRIIYMEKGVYQLSVGRKNSEVFFGVKKTHRLKFTTVLTHCIQYLKMILASTPGYNIICLELNISGKYFFVELLSINASLMYMIDMDTKISLNKSV